MIISTAAHGVRATITYTMQPSPYKGPADPGPFIGRGVLRVQSAGGTFTVPLRDLEIDAAHPSIFPRSPNQGCGVGAPLTIHHAKSGRTYIIVESLQIGKGCRAAAHVLDAATHKVVPEYAVDHASVHADDVPASTFTAQMPLRVSGVERFAIPASAPATGWTLTLIRGGGTEIFAENLPASETPSMGETVTLGRLQDRTFTAPLFVDNRTFRLSVAHERAWSAQQTPTPLVAKRSQQYNMYFEYSETLARDGQFAQALSAFRRALQYLDDTDLRRQEASDIPRLTSIVQAVRHNRMTIAQAEKAWFKL